MSSTGPMSDSDIDSITGSPLSRVMQCNPRLEPTSRKSESLGDHRIMVCISIPDGSWYSDDVPSNGSMTVIPYLEPISSLSLAESDSTVWTAPSTSPGLVLWSNEITSPSDCEEGAPLSPGVTQAPSSKCTMYSS